MTVDTPALDGRLLH